VTIVVHSFVDWGAAAAPNVAWHKLCRGKSALCQRGCDLTNYDVDVAGAALIKRATSRCRRAAICLAACRDDIFTLRPAAARPVTAKPGPSITSPRFTSIRASGALTPPWQTIRGRRAPSTSATTSRRNLSWLRSTIRARRASTASIRTYAREQVKQPGLIGPGIFAHRCADARQPAGDSVTRGQRRHPEGGRPGRAESLRLQERRADERVSIRPTVGKSSPAHLDFHLDQAVMYVSIETQNKCTPTRWTAARSSGDRFARKARRAEEHQGGQAAGHGHVHRRRFLYERIGPGHDRR